MAKPTASELYEASKLRGVTWGLLAGSCAIMLAHAPILIRLGQRMWKTDHYQFFPLILFGSAYLGYRSWIESADSVSLLSPGRRPVRVVLSIASLLLLSSAMIADSPWLAAISFMLTTYVCMYMLGGNELIRLLLPAWAFLWIAVPFPLGIDEFLIQQLQRTATQWASGLLDLLGYRHLVSGVILELPERSFEVEEACSGIHSLFAAVSCATFYGLLMQRGILRVVFLALTTVLWVLIVNVGRITAITVLCERWELPIATGFGHDVVGSIAFFVCMMLVISTEQLLLFFFPFPFRPSNYFALRRKKKKRKALSGSRGKRFLQPRDRSTVSNNENRSSLVPEVGYQGTLVKAEQHTGRFEGLPLAVLASLLLFGQSTFGDLLGNSDIAAETTAQISNASEEDLPRQIENWQRTGFEKIVRAADDENGEFSRVWQYQQDNITGFVSIDGPFVGWHNLGNCLAGQGWSIEETTIETLAGQAGDQEIPYVRLSIQKGLAQRAEVYYAVFDERCIPAKPADTYLGFRAIRRFPKITELLKRLSGTNDASYAAADSTTFQVQLFHESTEQVPNERTNELRRLFGSAVQVITLDWMKKDNPSKP